MSISLGPKQYLRDCTLLVSNSIGGAIDLSQLRIKFAIKHSDTPSPNSADIRVYNVSGQTTLQIQKEFKKVTLQAGYKDNKGVIFQGNIKQVIAGRESSTDTFIDIVAGDGDLAYNFAIINTPITKGSNPLVQANVVAAPMAKDGVLPGYMVMPSTTVLPRGKAFFGNSSDYLRQLAKDTGTSFSIQNEFIQFVPIGSILPGASIVLNSDTGLIGTPQQTNQGVDCKCLLNPLLKVGGTIFLNSDSIAQLKINLTSTATAASIPAPLTTDGVYYLYVIEHVGDSRGTDWYSNIITLTQPVGTNPLNEPSPF